MFCIVVVIILTIVSVGSSEGIGGIEIGVGEGLFDERLSRRRR
jgi:hypothetical protein